MQLQRTEQEKGPGFQALLLTILFSSMTRRYGFPINAFFRWLLGADLFVFRKMVAQVYTCIPTLVEKRSLGCNLILFCCRFSSCS